MRLQPELGIKQANLVGATLGMGAPLVEDTIFVSVLGSPYSTLGEGLVAGGVPELTDYTATPGHVDAIGAALVPGLGSGDALAALTFYTSVLGVTDSIAASTLVYGYGAEAPTGVKVLTASSTITFTQTNANAVDKPRTASSTLTLTQTNARAGVFSASANNTLALSQSNIVAGPKNVTASSTISFSQTASPGLLSRTASNTLFLTQLGTVGSVQELTASSDLVLSQSASPGLLSRTADSFLELEQSNNRFFIGQDSIPLTASSTITFAQTNNRYILGAGALTLTATSTLTFTQRAIFPIELTADSSITFTQQGDADALWKNGTHTIEFTQSAYLNTVRALTASNTLSLNHGFTYLQFRDGIPVVGDTGSCGITQQYRPLSGGDQSAAVRPVPPTLTRFTDVVFYYPTGTQCAATSSMTLRTPNFGDRDRNLYTRIRRESRGGSLRVYRDPQWPAERTLVMDFSGITSAEVDNILAFLRTTLGQKVSFRDWQGRVWSGIITTPDAQITFSGKENFDIAIEMEVDEDELQAAVCSQIVFTQSAVAVVE